MWLMLLKWYLYEESTENKLTAPGSLASAWHQLGNIFLQLSYLFGFRRLVSTLGSVVQLTIFYGQVIFFGISSQMCLIKVDFSLLLFPFGWHLLDFMTLGDVQNITWTWKRSTQQHATINVSLQSQCQILPCKVLIRISHSQIKSLRTKKTLHSYQELSHRQFYIQGDHHKLL